MTELVVICSRAMIIHTGFQNAMMKNGCVCIKNRSSKLADKALLPKIDDEFESKVADLKRILVKKLMILTEGKVSQGVKVTVADAASSRYRGRISMEVIRELLSVSDLERIT